MISNESAQGFADAFTDSWISEFWRLCEKRLNQRLSPYQVDRATGQINLDHHKLLNFNPSAYFQAPVTWDAPAQFNCFAFMEHCGLPELAPYTDRVRLTFNGKINVKSSSRLWFRLFGVEYDFANLQHPLQRRNVVRPEEITNPELIDFLESIG